jgi:hypothetical protein
MSPDDVAPILERILPHYRRLFSVLGTERDVSLCRPFLNGKIDTTLAYYLMSREKDVPLPKPKIPAGYRVRSLTAKQVQLVFPLEEKYQHEEVLIHPERFNRRAHMMHFRQVVSKQHVLFIETSEGPVAKAGTNSIGIGYCQIGGVYTLPAYRRQHLSRALMIHLLRWCRHAGYSAALFVRKENTAAVELYRGLSFDVETGYRIIYMV